MNTPKILTKAFAGHGPYGRQIRAMAKTIEQIVPMISSGKGNIVPEHFRLMHPIEREYIRILARFSRYTLQHLQGNPL